MGGARFCILQREISHLGAARGGPVLLPSCLSGRRDSRLDSVFGWLWVFHHDDSTVFATRPSRAKKVVSYFRGSLT